MPLPICTSVVLLGLNAFATPYFIFVVKGFPFIVHQWRRWACTMSSINLNTLTTYSYVGFFYKYLKIKMNGQTNNSLTQWLLPYPPLKTELDSIFLCVHEWIITRFEMKRRVTQIMYQGHLSILVILNLMYIWIICQSSSPYFQKFNIYICMNEL